MVCKKAKWVGWNLARVLVVISPHVKSPINESVSGILFCVHVYLLKFE